MGDQRHATTGAVPLAQEPTGLEEPVAGFPGVLEAPQKSQRTALLRKICVVIADDHAVVRDGLTGLLQMQPDIQVVGQAADGREAVEIARRLKPDVMLMDQTMPRLNGAAATKIITSKHPGICVIGLSMHNDPSVERRMKQAGARHYLTKSADTEKLIEAIRSCPSRE